MILDAKLHSKFAILGIVKFFTIVADNDPEDSKQTDDGLPCEVANVSLGNLY